MKEEASQVRRLRKHPIHRCAVPLPQWGRQRGGGFAAEKGSQPRLAALGSPFLWKEGPEGAEVGWGKRDEKEGEIIKSRRFTKAPSAKQLIKPIYSYKKRKSNAANDFNVIDRSGYRYMQEKSEAAHFL